MTPAAGLDELTRLSRAFGGPDFVKGGGGNTSFKTDDTLWVKPSGCALGDMAPDRFVPIDRPRLARLYAYVPAPDPATRESEVQVLMAEARGPGHVARPSVETPLHDLLEGAFVVHTHPMLVNGLTCAKDGAAAAARLFPEALWIPYTDPGYTLSMYVRTRLQAYASAHGHGPAVILLQNHGIFVAGPTGEAVRAHYDAVMRTLRAEYARCGMSTELVATEARDGQAELDAIRAVLGPDAAYAERTARFAVAEGPLTPDHMVYAKAQPYLGPLTGAGLAAFRHRWGYAPRVVVTDQHVWGVGTSAKAAHLALTLAGDGGLVRQLAGAFGGVQYLGEASRRFIEAWEIESYREQQALQS